MSETSNTAGVQVFGVTPDQVKEVVAGLESAGVGPVTLVDTHRVPTLNGTSHRCIAGCCYRGEGKCFAQSARPVLDAIPGVLYNIHHCQSGHCKREY